MIKVNGPHWKRWAPFCLDVDSIQSVEERLRNCDITIHVLFFFALALISKSLMSTGLMHHGAHNFLI